MFSVKSKINQIEKSIKFREELLYKNNSLIQLPSAELLKSSLLTFTQYFYKLRTGRDFIDYPAQGRASMLSQIIPLLEACVFENDLKKLQDFFRLYIAIAPRCGKTELILHFIAWGLANFPDSNFMYITYSDHLSRKHTKIIREIISLQQYQEIFKIFIKADSNTANHFILSTGGEVYGASAGGTITGLGAGLLGVDRFGGAAILDDLHKPEEAISSRASREKVISWYQSTFASRVNNRNRTPIILIGQRVHQEDIAGYLTGFDENGNSNDEHKWKSIVLPMLDNAGNSLRPDMLTTEQCREKARVMKYIWASQYQQNPTDDANALYEREDFKILYSMPDIEITFLTVDTACREKDWNDYTVFSFFGLYKYKIGDHVTDEWALHCLNCKQKRIEPDLIESDLMSFFGDCMNFYVKPKIIIIELAGVAYSISSSLKKKPGITVIDVQRSGSYKSKSQRFIDMQPHIKKGKVTFQAGSLHNANVIDHLIKITPNESHAHDDIADTVQMATEYCFDKQIIQNYIEKNYTEMPSINSFSNTSW